MIAMSSLLDSEAHFEKRAPEIGLDDAPLQALQTHGVATMGNQDCSHHRQRPAKCLVKQIYKSGCEHICLPPPSEIRRLFVGWSGKAGRWLQHQLTCPDGSAHKNVPEAERSRRLAQLKTSLPGLALEGPLEPSFNLLEKAAAIERQNQLRFLSPDIYLRQPRL